MLNVCQHSDSKTIQKVHKMHKNKDVEIFGLNWSHSEVFLKQNAATFSAKNVLHISFICCCVVLIVLELRTKCLGNCTETILKTTVQGQFEAFFYKFVLSRNESSPKQQIRPCLRRLYILVNELYRYFDKN